MDRGESVGTLYVDLITRDKTTETMDQIKSSLSQGALELERNFTKLTDKISDRIKFLPTLFRNFFGTSETQFKLAVTYMDSTISDATLKIKMLKDYLSSMNFDQLMFKPGLDMSLLEDVSKVPAIYIGALKQIAEYEKQIRKESAALTASYYDTMKFHAKDYYDYRVNLLQAEAEQLQTVLGASFDIASFLFENLKSLDKEREKFLTKWAEETVKRNKPSDNWTVPPSPTNPNPDRIWDPANPGLLQFVPDIPMPKYDNWNREELFKYFIESSRTGQTAFESMSKSIGDSLGQLKIRFSSEASEMEKIWGGMINSMIQKTTALIGQWLVLNTIAGIFGFAGINLGSFLGLSDPEKGSGGGYLNSWTGIKKFASGGDFIVPSGFPNDSYPMLVQSGERVRVTPTGNVGEEAKLLQRLISAVEANTIDRRMIGTRPVIVQPRIELGGRDLTKEVKRNEQIISREGFKSK